MMDYSAFDKIPEFPDSFRFDRFTRNGKNVGRLAHDVEWQTEINGVAYKFKGAIAVDGTTFKVDFELFESGRLKAFEECEWDFGTGAIDDLCVIYPSLPHDIGCHLTNKGWVPWKWRKVFDRMYRRGLKFYGCSAIRRLWQSAAIRANSKFVAYWKAEKAISE